MTLSPLGRVVMAIAAIAIAMLSLSCTGGGGVGLGAQSAFKPAGQMGAGTALAGGPIWY